MVVFEGVKKFPLDIQHSIRIESTRISVDLMLIHYADSSMLSISVISRDHLTHQTRIFLSRAV